jgi:hypothetical protein
MAKEQNEKSITHEEPSSDPVKTGQIEGDFVDDSGDMELRCRNLAIWFEKNFKKYEGKLVAIRTIREEIRDAAGMTKYRNPSGDLAVTGSVIGVNYFDLDWARYHRCHNNSKYRNVKLLKISKRNLQRVRKYVQWLDARDPGVILK